MKSWGESNNTIWHTTPRCNTQAVCLHTRPGCHNVPSHANTTRETAQQGTQGPEPLAVPASTAHTCCDTAARNHTRPHPRCQPQPSLPPSALPRRHHHHITQPIPLIAGDEEGPPHLRCAHSTTQSDGDDTTGRPTSAPERAGVAPRQTTGRVTGMRGGAEGQRQRWRPCEHHGCHQPPTPPACHPLPPPTTTPRPRVPVNAYRALCLIFLRRRFSRLIRFFLHLARICGYWVGGRYG